MRLSNLYSPLFAFLLNCSYAVAGEITQFVTDHDADKTYELREKSSEGTLLLIHADNELRIGRCDETSLAKVARPASNFTALVYVRECGATTDFATHVAIIDASRTSKAIAVFAGKPKISLEWSESGLEILHSSWPSELIYKQATQALGVNIIYKISTENASPTDPKVLALSSLNFGATGRAAGLPAEVLLRWAGWSQMASGLYKPEFGSWSGDAPYGDDPTGSTAILDGIRLYDTRYKKRN